MYHAPNGTYPSITNLLYEIVSKPGIQAWRDRVGHEKAQRISTKASIRGSKIHNAIEKYLLGNEDYLQGVAAEHIELVKLAIPQIDEKIDNIRGIELPLWSDALKAAGTTDLIAEYDTDKIAGSTIARNRNYARQLSELVNAGIQSRTDKNEKVKVTIDDFIDSIISFDNKNEQCNEILFALKVKLFENDIVKNSADKDTKSLLRSAKTPVEAIKLFDKLNG